MDKFSKIILITFFAVFGFGLLSVDSAGANTNGITITPEPIFNIENFLPGDSLDANVVIENNSGKNYQKIVIKGARKNTNESNQQYDLAEMIDLSVERGGKTEKSSLAELLDGNILELPDSEINDGESKTFRFVAEFKKEAGNEYQDMLLTFDFIFGFSEKETGDENSLDGYIVTAFGGGGFIALDLTIYEERVRVVETGEDFVVIAWDTNLPAFGRVIYDVRPDRFNFIEGEPAYGYAFYTPKTEKQDTFHSITLTGLNPGAIYYYRVVSYGSLAISREYSFITKGVKGWTTEEEEKAAEEKERIIEGVAPSAPIGEIGEPLVPEEVDLPEKEVVLDKEKAPQKGLVPMLASIGMALEEISQSTLKTIFVILLLAILTLIIVKEGRRQFQKKRNK